jgi:hypothetical protein
LDATGFGTGGGNGASSFDVAVNGYTATGLVVTLSDFSTAPLFSAGAFSESLTVVIFGILHMVWSYKRSKKATVAA